MNTEKVLTLKVCRCGSSNINQQNNYQSYLFLVWGKTNKAYYLFCCPSQINDMHLCHKLYADDILDCNY